MAFDIHPGNKRVITLAFTKADGSAGEIEGLPTWESSDAAILTVTPAADGLSADVVWAGVGSAVVTARADGDLGEGVFPITISETFTLLAPLGATAGTASVSEEVPA